MTFYTLASFACFCWIVIPTPTRVQFAVAALDGAHAPLSGELHGVHQLALPGREPFEPHDEVVRMLRSMQ